jgi:hypothetical protein
VLAAPCQRLHIGIHVSNTSPGIQHAHVTMRCCHRLHVLHARRNLRHNSLCNDVIVYTVLLPPSAADPNRLLHSAKLAAVGKAKHSPESLSFFIRRCTVQVAQLRLMRVGLAVPLLAVRPGPLVWRIHPPHNPIRNSSTLMSAFRSEVCQRCWA